jgi:RNA polymerase sigma-70 factor (ECF subfamily)
MRCPRDDVFDDADVNTRGTESVLVTMTKESLDLAADPHLFVEDDGPPSFELFFAAHYGRLYGSMWLVARDRVEAEEVVQEAFLRVWERWKHVSVMTDPAGYLFRTAMNLFMSRRRRAAVAIRRAVRTLPPEDGLARVEERDEVVRALASLTPRERAAIVLTELLGLTSEEAGRALRVRPSTVRVLAGRARASLRNEMGGRDE